MIRNVLSKLLIFTPFALVGFVLLTKPVSGFPTDHSQKDSHALLRTEERATECRYDYNDNGIVDRNEAVDIVFDFLFGEVRGKEPQILPSRQETVDLVALHLFANQFECPPEANDGCPLTLLTGSDECIVSNLTPKQIDTERLLATETFILGEDGITSLNLSSKSIETGLVLRDDRFFLGHESDSIVIDTEAVIPVGVLTLGADDLSEMQLTSISPQAEKVTSDNPLFLGADAITDSSLTSIVIGTEVELLGSMFLQGHDGVEELGISAIESLL